MFSLDREAAHTQNIVKILLVTLVLQRTMRDYSEAEAYLRSFDWCYACPPTATTRVILVRTDADEAEVRDRFRGYIDPEDDFCHVDSYDETEGAGQLLDAVDSLRAWLRPQ